ncbi:MAG: hypothetical protein JSV66_02830 [Trueperaceae bacterium]|nr:MAG: hypothetical protein JSV66_02830 [Trueperaceae bacterium]
MTMWIDWQALETEIPLDELPGFHRAFLGLVSPEKDWQEVFLRQVQGKVGASLKQLEREGLAKVEAGRLLVSVEMVPEAYRRYLEG